ncbi:MAG: beta-ketoacyl-[acyl-carrier-protein] synthase family protein [Chitinivibrionales bacterium]|nr:beta-ketoacyl-[acyl-carrier-protein] synthase family protein [Chitinivibrionales bacterium]
MKRRVVITGMGALCSCGSGVASIAEKLSAGTCCISMISKQTMSAQTPSFKRHGTYAALVGEFDDGLFNDYPWVKNADRYTHYALIAASQALQDARCDLQQIGSMGLVFATCSGPMTTIENYYGSIHDSSPAPLTHGVGIADPKVSLNRAYYHAAVILSRFFKLCGPSITITTACSSSTAALGIAADLIRASVVERVLVGGSDAVCDTTIAGFEGLRATAAAPCAPFSTPVGMNCGEGSGFIVVESLNAALQRGQPIYGELLGWASSNDAYHCSSPDMSGKGQIAAMKGALAAAGVTTADISYINGHGTGTAANDRAETRAVIALFGEHGVVPISSLKSLFGHCLGAAGILETIATLLCSRQNVFPPTLNFTFPRQGCTLDYISQRSRPWSGKKLFLKNSFAFAGNNVSLVIDASENRVAAVTACEKKAAENVIGTSRIGLTSCGMISAAGIGIESLCTAVNRNLVTITDEQANGRTIQVARVAAFNERLIHRSFDFRTVDKATRYCTISTYSALLGSGRNANGRSNNDVGVYISLDSGSTAAESIHIQSLLNNDLNPAHIQSFPYVVPNSVLGSVCRILGLTGHNTVFCHGADGGLASLCFGALALRNGHCTLMLAGAVDEIVPHQLDENAAEEQHCPRYALSEGSVIFGMKRLADTTGADDGQCMAVIRGFHLSTTPCEQDNPQWFSLHQAAIAKAIQAALDSAGLQMRDIDYICYRQCYGPIAAAVRSLAPSQTTLQIDVSRHIGTAQSSAILFSLAYALHGVTRRKETCREYIIAISASEAGANAVMVFEKGSLV